MTRDKDRPRRPSSKRPAPGERDAKSNVEKSNVASSPVAPAPSRQRIAKVIARAGLCSRRDAEAWIVEGRVAVNGEVLTSPAIDVGPTDAIVVDDEPLPVAEKTRLFLFHKPRGLVTSDHDPEGRATVADHLREHWPGGPRVVTIGRLDINTEGLLLLTNDGGLARVLELPKTGWVRRYRVRAKGETDQGVLDRLRDGLSLEGVDYAGIEATLDRIQGANCWLTMGLREGKNREIKRVLEHLGLEVNRLIRLSFGPFQLLDLEEGKVEEVRTRILRDQLGERIAAEAGVTFESADEVVAPAADHRDGERIAAPAASRPKQRAAPGRDRRDTRGEAPSQRGRIDRRAPERTEEPELKRRERPVAGTRKHVSALRADRAEAPSGVRRRIERSDVKDRRERTIAVERLVPTRTDKDVRTGTARRGTVRGAANGADHASPSAQAKRQRVARSGTGGRPARDDSASNGRREDRTADRGRPRTRVDADRTTSRADAGAAGRRSSAEHAPGTRRDARSDASPPRRADRTSDRGRPATERDGPRKPFRSDRQGAERGKPRQGKADAADRPQRGRAETAGARPQRGKADAAGGRPQRGKPPGTHASARAGDDARSAPTRPGSRPKTSSGDGSGKGPGKGPRSPRRK